MGETQIIQNFEKAHPDIDIKVEIVPWDELHTKYLAAYSAGNAPDVIRVDPTQLLLLERANSLAPLDPYLKSWSQSTKNDFFHWNGTVIDGKKYAMPVDENVFTLVYRKDLFAEKHLAPPKSWDDFVNDAKALTTNDRWGFAFPAARSGSYFHVIFAPFVWGSGGQLLDSNGQAAFNSPADARALGFLYDLVHKYKVAPPDVTSLNLQDVMQGFMAGKYAMVIEGAIRYSSLEQSNLLKGNLGVAFMPSPNGTAPAPAYATGGWNLGINPKSAHKDQAWQFLDFYTSQQSQEILARVAGDFPTRKSVFSAPFMKTPEHQYLQSFYQVLEKASRGPVLSDRFGELFDNDLMIGVQRVFAGEKPQPVLSDVETQFNAK